MNRKTFIIDTNVLIHDPKAIHQFEKCKIAIPGAVLAELRSRKGCNKARQAIRFIDVLLQGGDSLKGVDIGKETILQIISVPSEDQGSHKIIQIAKHLKREGQPVVILSKDFEMREEADSMGIDAEDFESRNTSSIYKGLRRMQRSKEDIDLFYTQGFLEMADEEFHPNEYCIIHSPEKSSAVCKFNPQSKRLEPLINLKRDVWGIHPLNVEQRCAIDLLLRDDIKLVTFIGKAGTGKTLMALACALRKVFDENAYRRILVSRPVMPLGKDIGYLPGTKEEKMLHWMQPIYDNLDFLLETTGGENNVNDTKGWILESGKLEMEAVTYIRGRSLSKAFIIIDEAQNLTPHEVKTIISRAGHGTKVILTGDPWQIDNHRLDKENNALTYVVDRFKNQGIYGHMVLDKSERSPLAALAAELL